VKRREVLTLVFLSENKSERGLFIVRFHRSHFFQFERETNDFCGGVIIEREEEETEDVETNDPCTKHHDRPYAPRYDGRRRKQHRWWRIPEFYRRRAATLSLKCWCWRRRRRRRLEVVLGAVDRVPDEIHVALRGENGAPVRLVYELAGNGTHGARNPNVEREPSVFGGVQLTVWVPPV
tara:strand:- start:118 stop:654 length:537 start_codon:yes stop_codon:yes gene_type:complete